MSWGARHRAATKPMALTSRNRIVKMTISVMWWLMTSPPLRHLVDDAGGDDADQNEEKLQQEEGGEAPQPGRVVIEQRGQHGQHDRDDQQPVPRAAVGAGHRH